MIIIKNLKVFNCSINESFHWSKLPKLKEVMRNNRLIFLSGSDLRWSDLSGSNLSGSDLRWSNLSRSDLRWSNLSWSNLSGSDLSGAKLAPIDDEVIIDDFITVCGLGSENRQTLIFNTNIGIVLQCGCFYGTEKQFRKKVKETHGSNNYAKEYLEMLKLAKIRFAREEE